MQPEIYLNKYLSSLLANPERVSEEDIALLKDSVQRYPYFQPLYLLLAKAGTGMDGGESMLVTTALHTNGVLLHKFLYSTSAENPVRFTRPATGTEEAAHQIYTLDEVETASDEQETFDEIGEVDYHEFSAQEPAHTKVENAPAIETIEDDFVLENIAATDCFAFEKNFIPDAVQPEEQQVPALPERAAATTDMPQTADPAEQESNEVSNYNDDTLPYTFLWWLAKTRKEHQSTFQPYASPRNTRQTELQQQYVEHIFHLQSPFNAEQILSTIPEVKGDPKDLEIIDQFIKNAPQITAPRPEQIDNENKAKKSAEDHNDLVSETLAKIYIEQMLYHKAIETYEKLSLKFPEKSRYFADLIQSIQKKI